MKLSRGHRFWIYSAAAVVFLAVWAVIWRFSNSVPDTGELKSSAPAATSRHNGSRGTDEWGSQAEWAASETTDEFSTAIAFFGRVVDEANRPVEGAEILFSSNDNSPAGTTTYHGASDTAGRFSISKIRGKWLSVRVTKSGYYTSRRNPQGFMYAGENPAFKPDSEAPVVFRLRKKGIAEPLLRVEFPGAARYVFLPTNGNPVALELTSGKVVEPGSPAVTNPWLVLQFWVDRAESRQKPRYPWRCLVRIENSQLQLVSEEFPFLAPLDGYQSADEIGMLSPTDAKWEATVERSYFYRTVGGCFGRLHLKVLSHNGLYRVESFLNPTGSRNLEYDPAVQPKPKVYE